MSLARALHSAPPSTLSDSRTFTCPSSAHSSPTPRIPLLHPVRLPMVERFSQDLLDLRDLDSFEECSWVLGLVVKAPNGLVIKVGSGFGEE